MPPGTDPSDAWVSFTATGGQLAMYASVVDNLTTDQYYVPAVPETQDAPRIFDVTLQNFSISVSPALTGLRVGDSVKLRIRNLGGAHGFTVQSPNFQPAVPNTGVLAVGPVIERTFTISMAGAYAYFCTLPSCGQTSQHDSMSGEFTATAP